MGYVHEAISCLVTITCTVFMLLVENYIKHTIYLWILAHAACRAHTCSLKYAAFKYLFPCELNSSHYFVVARFDNSQWYLHRFCCDNSSYSCYHAFLWALHFIWHVIRYLPGWNIMPNVKPSKSEMCRDLYITLLRWKTKVVADMTISDQGWTNTTFSPKITWPGLFHNCYTV